MPGREIVTVIVSTLSRAARPRAAGSLYSAAGTDPAVVGIDGVERTESGPQV